MPEKGGDGPRNSNGHQFGYEAARAAGLPWGYVNGQMSPAEKERAAERKEQDEAQRQRLLAEIPAEARRQSLLASYPDLEKYRLARGRNGELFERTAEQFLNVPEVREKLEIEDNEDRRRSRAAEALARSLATK